jgi:hypothetical protein
LPLRARNLLGYRLVAARYQVRTAVEPEQAGQLDDGAGPVVRPYVLTGGRAWPTGKRIDLIALAAAIHGRRRSG